MHLSDIKKNGGSTKHNRLKTWTLFSNPTIMVFLLCSSHIVILLSPSRFKTPFFRTQFRAKTFVSFPSNSNQWKVKKIRIQCASVSSEGEAHDWRKWVPKNVNFGADKVLKSIAGATSSPICQFISSPSTVLHDVDPRIKLVASIFLFWILVVIFIKCWKWVWLWILSQLEFECSTTLTFGYYYPVRNMHLIYKCRMLHWLIYYIKLILNSCEYGIKSLPYLVLLLG